jgi:hypothetical protein
MPITEYSKHNKWDTIITIAKNNEFPISILTGLKKKIMKRKNAKTIQNTTTRNKNTAM